MELVYKYHSLLNSAIELVNEKKNSSSFFEKALLYHRLQKIEFELQVAEFVFLHEDEYREFT